MSALREWSALSEAWQGQAAPAIDVDALRAEVRRRDRHLRWALAGEVLLCLLMVAACLFVFLNGNSTRAERQLLVGLTVCVLAYQAWVLRLRWGDLGLGGTDAAALLALEIRRCHSTLAYWRWGMWTAMALVVALYGLFLSALHGGVEGLSPAGLAGGFVANAVLFPLMGLYGWWRCRDARRRLAHLESLRAQLAA